MRRFIIALIAVCFCINSNAQVQTKFWGLEMSKTYYVSLETLKDIISYECEYAEIEGDTIDALDGSFGGREWDFSRFSFYNDGQSNRLYSVRFSSYHNSYDSAKNKYDSLLRSLSSKYGEARDYSKSENELSKGWMFMDSPYGVTLDLTFSESKGGGWYWYVVLWYMDYDTYNLSAKQDDAEL